MPQRTASGQCGRGWCSLASPSWRSWCTSSGSGKAGGVRLQRHRDKVALVLPSVALGGAPVRRTKVRAFFGAIVLNERPMGRFVVERILATLLFVLGGAGLLVAVLLALREGTWVSTADVSTSGLGWWRVATVALGLAWFSLFWGIGLVLELLIELSRRDRSNP